MTTDRFQQLLQTADPADQAELKLAHNTRIEAMKAVQSRPGKATIDDLTAARGFYEQTLARIWSKHHPADTPAAEGERFANRKQALNWLQAQGYKISQGKFYGDCAAGYPAIHRDGTVSRFQVLQYAQQQDVDRRATSTPVDLASRREDAETRKAESDAAKAEMQAEEMRRLQDRRWILRETAEEEICVWVSRMRDAAAYHLGKILLAVIHTAGGSADRLAEVQALVDAALAAACNEISKSGEMTVLIEDDEATEC